MSDEKNDDSALRMQVVERIEKSREWEAVRGFDFCCVASTRRDQLRAREAGLMTTLRLFGRCGGSN